MQTLVCFFYGVKAKQPKDIMTENVILAWIQKL